MSSSSTAITQLLATLALFAAACWVYALLRLAHRKHPAPPSPPSDPLIGHLRILPSRDQHIAYRQWGQELKSDVISLRVPGQTIIVLNSERATTDLLDKRSKKYSGRPFIPMIMDPTLIDLSRHTAFLQYGERWKRQRQLMHLSFRKSAMHQHWPAQTKHAREAALRIAEQPNTVVATLERMSGNLILSCVYGHEVASSDDYILRLIQSAADHLNMAVLPTNFLVNVIPWLKYLPSWLPGTEWRGVVREWREEVKRTIELPYEYAFRQAAAGVVSQSAVNEMLKSSPHQLGEVTTKEHDEIMWTAGSIFTAASESMHSTLQVFILAMTLYPHVQAKIQDEILQTTGGKRLPELQDMQDMPYVRCVILELLRWQPVTPLGIPHTCEEDDVYNGYAIPKGSTVFGNIWAINRDPSRYEAPESFIPERFLDANVPEPVTFGFGRRQCPGMHFARETLFINIATLLATCNVKPAHDENGRDILPVVNMIKDIVKSPAPFECSITPRSEVHRQILINSIENA